jgi:spermidine/putrescine-binding protein
MNFNAEHGYVYKFAKYDIITWSKPWLLRERRKSLLYVEIEVTEPSHYRTVGNRKTSEELIFVLKNQVVWDVKALSPDI